MMLDKKKYKNIYVGTLHYSSYLTNMIIYTFNDQSWFLIF